MSLTFVAAQDHPLMSHCLPGSHWSTFHRNDTCTHTHTRKKKSWHSHLGLWQRISRILVILWLSQRSPSLLNSKMPILNPHWMCRILRLSVRLWHISPVVCFCVNQGLRCAEFRHQGAQVTIRSKRESRAWCCIGRFNKTPLMGNKMVANDTNQGTKLCLNNAVK